MRHLGAIAELAALTVLDARQDLGGSVALETITRGRYRKPFSNLWKNRLAAMQDVEDISVLVDGAPKIAACRGCE